MSDDPNADLFKGGPVDPYGGPSGEGSKNPRGTLTFGGTAETYNPATGQTTASSADTAAQGYNNAATAAANAPTQSLNYGGANNSIGRAQWDEGNANDARRSQQDALSLSKSAAEGGQPSQAELLGRNQVDQGLKSQLAGAASARGGPLATMSAQRNVQQGAAAQTQQGANSLAAMRAGEMANARSAYAGQAGDIRSGDYTGQGLNNQAAGIQANMAQGEGAYQQQQRELAAKKEMGYRQLGYSTLNDQANRGVQYAGIESGAQQHQTDTNEASKRDAQGVVEKIIGGGSHLLGGLLAKGGPASGGQPYLVGEKGPELIVPRHDGYVMTADQTANILAHARHRASGGSVDGGALPSLSFGSNSPTVDMGGGGGISQGQVLAASTGHEGSASPVHGTIGGGGVTGGDMPHLGGAGGGGGSGHGLSYGARAKGGPVKGNDIELGNDEEAGANADPYDVDRIKSGGIIRNDPYSKDDPWTRTQAMLDDRAEQTKPAMSYTPSYVPPSAKAPESNWLEDTAGPNSPNAKSLEKEQNAAVDTAVRKQEKEKKSEGGSGGEKKSNEDTFSLNSGLGSLGSGIKRLATREEGGRIVGFDRDSRSLQDAHAKLGQTFRDQARKGEKIEGVSETERPERDGWGGALRHLLTREEGGAVSGVHEAAKSGALGAGGLLASHLSQGTRDRLASAAYKANDMGVFGIGGVLGHLNHEKQLKPLAEQAAAHGALGGGAATGHAAYAATAEPVKREGGGVVEGGEIEDPLPHKGAGLSLSDLGALKTREPTSFVHHPRASQAEISRDKMKEADRLIASYDRSLGRGAAVARDEGEIDSAPGWLDAYMAKEREEPQKLAYAPRKGR